MLENHLSVYLTLAVIFDHASAEVVKNACNCCLLVLVIVTRLFVLELAINSFVHAEELRKIATFTIRDRPFELSRIELRFRVFFRICFGLLFRFDRVAIFIQLWLFHSNFFRLSKFFPLLVDPLC